MSYNPNDLLKIFFNKNFYITTLSIVSGMLSNQWMKIWEFTGHPIISFFINTLFWFCVFFLVFSIIYHWIIIPIINAVKSIIKNNKLTNNHKKILTFLSDHCWRTISEISDLTKTDFSSTELYLTDMLLNDFVQNGNLINNFGVPVVKWTIDTEGTRYLLRKRLLKNTLN